MKRYILIAIAFFILVGCAARNNFVETELLSTEKIDMIRNKETSKEKVLEIFGIPYNHLVVGDKETFFYKDENLNTLWVRFGKEGRVDKFVSTKR